MRVIKRLRAIADLVVNVDTVADIGADHGELSKMLIEEHRADHVIATDISDKSLDKTRRLIVKRHLTERIETRVGDGLSPIFENEVQLAIIAGMGGQEIIRILKAGKSKKVKRYILAPAQNVEELREYLSENLFDITYDGVVKDHDKFYFYLDCYDNGKGKRLSETEILFGRSDYAGDDFKTYLDEYIKKREQILSGEFKSERREKELRLAMNLKQKIK